MPATKERGTAFIKLGTVLEAPELVLVLSPGRAVTVDVPPCRNLSFEVGADMQRYMSESLPSAHAPDSAGPPSPGAVRPDRLDSPA